LANSGILLVWRYKCNIAVQVTGYEDSTSGCPQYSAQSG